MTIEEAIQHCEQVAAGETEQGKCPKCAAEHKQLAGWLRELVAFRTQQIPPNDPLTLEELREMDGEPVYVTGLYTDCKGKRHGAWALVDVKQEMCRVHGGGLAIFENRGKSWLAYRRKPEAEKVEPGRSAPPGWAEHFQSRFDRVE